VPQTIPPEADKNLLSSTDFNIPLDPLHTQEVIGSRPVGPIGFSALQSRIQPQLLELEDFSNYKFIYIESRASTLCVVNRFS
jgi:hypothetical protein